MNNTTYWIHLAPGLTVETTDAETARWESEHGARVTARSEVGA